MTELKHLNKAEIDHFLITMPSKISTIEVKLAEKKQEYELVKNVYDVAFAGHIQKSKGTNELSRKSDAIIATDELKQELIKKEMEYLKTKAEYHMGLNRHESIVELARNKRAEIKAQIDTT